MHFKLLSLLLALAAGLSGCSGVNAMVIPNPDNTMEIVAYRSESYKALSATLRKAKEVCKEEEKKYIVLSRDIKYQGLIDETANKVAKTTSGAIYRTSGINIPTPARSDDYKATILVRCS